MTRAMVDIFEYEWVTRYDLTTERIQRKRHYELSNIVQTLKTCKVYHKRAAAGGEENSFRDP